ncbi:AAA-like domain-containing protein [Candidatus Marithrix sp. Canyon 246]|uniref:AAA-like domain-containing protein n=1 Tax=Candidatus Marithrix sp. Canyon 246 TaxID=1827136 RepID=UPI000849F846|nr:AAA-like domain-containing protein [Candidatus Marithrix sp. Canyon 246]
MRKFSSYGPIDLDLHYYVPRQELIDKAFQHNKGGHYITIWAPRQTGKTWIMREVFLKLKKQTEFDVIILPLQHLSNVTDVNRVVQVLSRELIEQLNLGDLSINTLEDFELLFKRQTLTKPLILILDEFDGLDESVISLLVGFFRNIYNKRQNEVDKSTAEKKYLLHSLALIGVRSVLGVENMRGSPFNVQRSLHIPNLTADEVVSLFNSYQQQTGQSIDSKVVERIFYEFQGQPGLTCWFGELLTETYNEKFHEPITMENFEDVYAAALDLLPNNNILNIISKAKQEAYKPFVLDLFQTKTESKFLYDEPIINFLYLNGIIDIEQVSLRENYIKFACPYIQKRLFNYFTREVFRENINYLSDPFEDLSDTITADQLNIRRLLERYEDYLQINKEQILKDAPRRNNDLRVYEAVFHFNLYFYLTSFLNSYDAIVQPEFPTGNGQIDLLIRHAGQLFGLELKSFASQAAYRKALIQAAKYGKSLQIAEIFLVFFVETIDETNRQKFEKDYMDSDTGVMVHPKFVQIHTLV